MAKGIDRTREAIDKLRVAEAELHAKIKQQKQRLRQAERAQRDRQATEVGRIAMALLPESFYIDAALLTGFYLSSQFASPETMEAWRKSGEQHIESNRQP